jgi:hypothetical protein
MFPQMGQLTCTLLVICRYTCSRRKPRALTSLRNKQEGCSKQSAAGMEKKMSEQKQKQEPGKSDTLISMLTLAGIIAGTIVLLVGLFNLHTNGIVPGLVDSIVLILAWAIAGIPIGLLVLRRFNEQASSRILIIGVSAFSGLLGGAMVVGVLALCFAYWYVGTHCC